MRRAFRYVPNAVRIDPNTANHYGDGSVYDTPSLFFVNPTDYGVDPDFETNG